MRMVRRVNGFSVLSLFSLFSFQGIRILNYNLCRSVEKPDGCFFYD